MLVESGEPQPGARVAASLIKPSAAGIAQVLTSNSHLITRSLRDQLIVFLGNYSHVFGLTEGERGEIDLRIMCIDARNAIPKKQPVRRIPFAVHQEVTRQLLQMQKLGKRYCEVHR